MLITVLAESTMPFHHDHDIRCEIDKELELVKDAQSLLDTLIRTRTPDGAYRFIISPLNQEDDNQKMDNRVKIRCCK